MDAESRWLVEKEFRERLSNNSRIKLVREFWHKTLFFLTCFNFEDEEREKESSRCWKPPSFWNEFWPFRLLLCSKPTGVRLDMLHCRCRLCVYRVIKRRRRSFAVANKSWRCVKKKREGIDYICTHNAGESLEVDVVRSYGTSSAPDSSSTPVAFSNDFWRILQLIEYRRTMIHRSNILFLFHASFAAIFLFHVDYLPIAHRSQWCIVNCMAIWRVCF